MAVGDYVTLEGLVIPSVEQLLAEISADQKLNIDPDLNTEEDSPIGEANAIFASHLREGYEVARIGYGAFDPDNAEGFLLEGVSALTGTERAPATYSRFEGSRRLRVTLAANKTVGPGVVFRVAGNEAVRFVTTDTAVSTTPGDYYISARCETSGPVHCNAGTLTEIATPVIGLDAVTNDYDAILGQAVDSDARLRQRREEELRATGAGTVDALAADVRDIQLDDESKPIQSAVVFENYTMLTDDKGLPPKSLEVMLFDGIAPACPDSVIAATIWKSRPGGIELVGNTSGTTVDSLGYTRTVPFTRPTVSEIKFQITLEIDVLKYAGDELAITLLLSEFRVKVKAGGVIRANDCLVALKRLQGVIDVTNMQIARVPAGYPPSGTNLVLGLREMGNVESGNVHLTTVPGIP